MSLMAAATIQQLLQQHFVIAKCMFPLTKVLPLGAAKQIWVNNFICFHKCAEEFLLPKVPPILLQQTFTSALQKS